MADTNTDTKKTLPVYTKGEEIFNYVTHIVGAAIGVAALVLGVVFACLNISFYIRLVVGISLYGACMIILYTASSLYHALPVSRAKRIFRIFDHCTIFLLIAGTYSPICLYMTTISGFEVWGWSLLSFIWGSAVVGIILNAYDMHNKFIHRFSQISYLVMGWCAIIAIYPLLKIFANATMWPFLVWMLLGGIAYTVGVLLFYHRKKPYYHSVWHIFVVIGSLFHFFGIFFYIVL
jgi:hemolysin III